MKLKKKFKKNKNKQKTSETNGITSEMPSDHTSQIRTTSYPEENNPFSEETPDKGDNLKGKKKKIKKEKKRKNSKKAKKLKGKRERAVSKAVLSEINDNNNLKHSELTELKSRSPTQQSTGRVEPIRKGRATSSFLEVGGGKPREKSPSRVAQLKQEAGTSSKLTSSKPEALGLKPNRLSSGDLKKLHGVNKRTDDVTKRPDEVAKGPEEKIKRRYETTHPTEQTSSTSSKHLSVTSSKQATSERDKIEEQIEEKSNARDRAATRKGRTGSVLVSSRERRKRKRLRLAKKWKRLKNREKKPEGDSESLKNFNPRPANRKAEHEQMVQLRNKVEEVKEITQHNVAVELEKRESALIQLAENTETLEKFAESFAKTGHDMHLKKKAQSRCCGLFSKHRACWYICACDRGFKKNKIKKNAAFTRANADTSDDEEPYQTALLGGNSQLRHETITSQSKGKTDATMTSSTSSLQNSVRNSKLFLRLSSASLPFLDDPSKRNSGSDQRIRNSSSTNDIHEIITSNNKHVNRRARKSIGRIVSQFDDEEKRKRATELLLLDHD